MKSGTKPPLDDEGPGDGAAASRRVDESLPADNHTPMVSGKQPERTGPNAVHQTIPRWSEMRSVTTEVLAAKDPRDASFRSRPCEGFRLQRDRVSAP